jgi:hypothetical protein
MGYIFALSTEKNSNLFVSFVFFSRRTNDTSRRDCGWLIHNEWLRMEIALRGDVNPLPCKYWKTFCRQYRIISGSFPKNLIINFVHRKLRFLAPFIFSIILLKNEGWNSDHCSDFTLCGLKIMLPIFPSI